MSLQISERTTNYTHNTENVIYHNRNNMAYVSHRTESTKQFQSDNEIDHVIHYLVVQSGYLMENDRNGTIVFTHSHNDTHNYTKYYYDTTNRVMTKVSERFLDFV